jgi:hypothetical protein
MSGSWKQKRKFVSIAGNKFKPSAKNLYALPAVGTLSVTGIGPRTQANFYQRRWKRKHERKHETNTFTSDVGRPVLLSCPGRD